jgi:hypothetical protein
MVQESPDITLETDASDFGWGFAVRDVDGRSQDVGHGRWRATKLTNSINWRELRAVVHAVDRHAMSWEGLTIQVKTDNITTCAIINRQGSRRYSHLQELANRLAYLSNVSKIRLLATYLPGIDNIVADRLSRKVLHPQHEMQLHPKDFRLVQQHFGPRSVDLFASQNNQQVATYYSLHPDQRALGMDAMCQRWKPGVYAFPPMVLVNRILRKIHHQPVQDLVLVTPAGTTQPWWSDLVTLTKNNIFLPHTSNLIAWHISTPGA